MRSFYSCLFLVVQWVGLFVATDALAEAEPASLPPSITEGVIAAPLADVWKVFTTAEGFKKLGVAHCELECRVGGLIRSHYDPMGKLGDDGTIQNEYLAFDPMHMVAFRIHKPPKKFPFAEETWKKTWSVATLTSLGEQLTHLRLVGYGYPNTDDGKKMKAFFDQGNGWTLKHLQEGFAKAGSKPTSQPGTLDAVSLREVVDLPTSEVWKLLTTSEGWKKTLKLNSTIELRPGGKFELVFIPTAPVGKQGSEGCTVLSILPGEMLSFTWSAPPTFAHARTKFTWVVVRLKELGPKQTLVMLDHLGFAEQASENPDHRDEWVQVRGYFQGAWSMVLKAIQGQAKKE